MIVYEKVRLDFSVINFFPVPSEFVDNFIMGFLSFETPRSNTIIDFKSKFETVGGVEGVYFPISVAQTYKPCGSTAVPFG